MASLTEITNRKYFSATQWKAYAQTLLNIYAVAVGNRYPFYYTMNDSGYGNWEGHILHVSNTFRWRTTPKTGSNVVIEVNDVQVAETSVDGASGTVDISALGLTLGNVYTITAHCYTADSKITWLGEVVTGSYAAPPTFVDSTVPTIDDFDDVRSGILALDALAACPCSPAERYKITDSIYGKSSDRGGSLYVSRGTFCWMGQDTLGYSFQHGGTAAGDVTTVITLNGSTAYSIGESTGGTFHTGTADISAIVAGFTLGNFYEFLVRTKIENTAKKVKCFCDLRYLNLQSTYAPASTPAIWAHGGQNINEDNLNWYSNLINALFPGSGSEECALYYEYPAVRENPDTGDDSSSVVNHSFTVEHRHKYAHYEPVSAQIPLLTWASSKANLEEDDGDHICDIDKYNIGYGERYQVGNVLYVMESETGE
jgi:hypothetical protein